MRSLEVDVPELYTNTSLCCIDDSLSMRTQQKGARIPALTTTLRNVARIYQLARPEGIKDVRFLNSINKAPNIRVGMVKGMMSAHQFRGQTRIGTELKRKVLKDYVSATMQKPLLVVTITDGDVSPHAHPHPYPTPCYLPDSS